MNDVAVRRDRGDLDLPELVLVNGGLADAAGSALDGFVVRARRFGHAQCDVLDAVAVACTRARNLVSGMQRTGDDKADLPLLQDVARPVADACLRPGVGGASEPECLLVVEGCLLGVPDPELDVIPAVERHEVLAHERESTAVVAGVAAAASTAETSSSERLRRCSFTHSDGDHPDEHGHDGGGEERRPERIGETLAGRRGQPVDRDPLADAHARRQPVVDDRAHDGDADRCAHLPRRTG